MSNPHRTQKFTEDPSFQLKGFWKPDTKGQTVEGYILDSYESEFDDGRTQRTLVVQLSADTKVEKKDRDSGDKITVTAKAGTNIGVNMKAKMKGLDRRKNHWVKIVFLEEIQEKGDDGQPFRTKLYDIEFSETPIPVQDRVGVKKGGKESRAS